MNDKDPCELTLFVACFEEEQGIIPSIETVVAAAQETAIRYDIVVVDDCSKDNSVKLVQEYMAQHPEVPLMLVVNQVNQGFGLNFVEASFRGRGKYYRGICGDDTETKETLVSVFKRLGEADMILTYHTDAGARAWSRRVISRSYTALINLLSGHKIKYYNGLAVHHRYNVMRWHSNSHGFGFQADLVTPCWTWGQPTSKFPPSRKSEPRAAPRPSPSGISARSPTRCWRS